MPRKYMELTRVSATATAACGGAASNHTGSQRSSVRKYRTGFRWNKSQLAAETVAAFALYIDWGYNMDVAIRY